MAGSGADDGRDHGRTSVRALALPLRLSWWRSCTGRWAICCRLRQPSPLDGVILLDGEDRLTDEAMDIACDYNHVLFHGRDPASDWLPGWAWQRGEQVERLLFQSLIQSGSQDAYEASRRFVIERPARAARAHG